MRLCGRLFGVCTIAALLGGVGCATIREVVALHEVDFRIDHLAGLRLAGVDLSRVRSYQDLGLMDVGRLSLALAGGEVPLEFSLHLRAENPSTNTVQARLVGMAWTLYLKDQETISGSLEEPIVLPPGEPKDIPVAIRLDLLKFFQGGAQDLVDLALSLARGEGSGGQVSLKVIPTVDTPLGPIRYPQPIAVIGR